MKPKFIKEIEYLTNKATEVASILSIIHVIKKFPEGTFWIAARRDMEFLVSRQVLAGDKPYWICKQGVVPYLFSDKKMAETVAKISGVHIQAYPATLLVDFKETFYHNTYNSLLATIEAYSPIPHASMVENYHFLTEYINCYFPEVFNGQRLADNTTFYEPLCPYQLEEAELFLSSLNFTHAPEAGHLFMFRNHVSYHGFFDVMMSVCPTLDIPEPMPYADRDKKQS